MPRYLTSLILLATLCGLTMYAPAAAQAGEARIVLAKTDGPSFTLQLATFSEAASARTLAAQLPDAWVQEIRQNGQARYRVNYKRFGSRTDAIRAQWDLEDLGFDSFIAPLYGV